MESNRQSNSKHHISSFNIGRFLLWAIIPFVLDMTLFAAVGMAGMSGTGLGKLWPNLSPDNSLALTVTLMSSLFFFLIHLLAKKRDELIGLLFSAVAMIFIIVWYFWGFNWMPATPAPAL